MTWLDDLDWAQRDTDPWLEEHHRRDDELVEQLAEEGWERLYRHHPLSFELEVERLMAMQGVDRDEAILLASRRRAADTKEAA